MDEISFGFKYFVRLGFSLSNWPFALTKSDEIPSAGKDFIPLECYVVCCYRCSCLSVLPTPAFSYRLPHCIVFSGGMPGSVGFSAMAIRSLNRDHASVNLPTRLSSHVTISGIVHRKRRLRPLHMKRRDPLLICASRRSFFSAGRSGRTRIVPGRGLARCAAKSCWIGVTRSRASKNQYKQYIR